MQEDVDELLDRRRQRRPYSPLSSLAIAGALHVTMLAAALLAPRLAAQRPQQPEYVAVQIVPLQALGVERPAKPSPVPPEPKPPKPAPEPIKPEEPPVMPEPAKKPTTKPDKKPAVAPPAPTVAPTPATEPPSDETGKQGAAAGLPNGTAAVGAPIATLDNPDFTYGYYLEQMLALIRAQWVRPPLGGGIEASVHFQIARNGEISDLRIVQSSGYSSFDLAGMRAVQSASPLPPLPSGYKQGSLGVTLIIR